MTESWNTWPRSEKTDLPGIGEELLLTDNTFLQWQARIKSPNHAQKEYWKNEKKIEEANIATCRHHCHHSKWLAQLPLHRNDALTCHTHSPIHFTTVPLRLTKIFLQSMDSKTWEGSRCRHHVDFSKWAKKRPAIGPRFESGRGRCVESLDKALYSHCPKEKPSH